MGRPRPTSARRSVRGGRLPPIPGSCQREPPRFSASKSHDLPGRVIWSPPIGLPLPVLLSGDDTGGAIRGAGRADLFWGTGDEAKRYAGVMKRSSRLYYLVPKE